MAEYTISELADLSGVSRRNIHFYVQQGLLPPPEGAGLGARYGDEHLARLRAIPVLRAQGLRLDEIRAQLGQASPRDIEQLLVGRRPLPPVPAALSLPAPAARAAPAPAALMRYTLAPGVDLLVDAELAAAHSARVAELLRAAQAIFRQSPDFHSNGGQS